MSTFSEALLPVFSVIVIGYAFKYYAFPGDGFWPLTARITYFAFFPALLLSRLATSRLEDLAIVPMALAIIIPILVIALLLIAVRPTLPITNAAFTSVFQGGIRFNTYVGLAVAAALYGDSGVTIAAIALAMLIPLVNVLSVIVLTRYVSNGSTHWRDTLLSLIKNPLIIACVLGMVLSWSGIGLPFGTDSVLEIFSRAALPLGLLTAGADLDLKAVKASTYPVLVASGAKLLGLPLLTVLVCYTLSVSSQTAAIVVLFAALPTAPSAYILAQQLGGDVKLMAGIITVQTVLALITLPVVAMFW